MGDVQEARRGRLEIGRRRLLDSFPCEAEGALPCGDPRVPSMHGMPSQHNSALRDRVISAALDGSISIIFRCGSTASFPVRVQDGQTDADLEKALAQLPDLLTYSFNLGVLVFFL